MNLLLHNFVRSHTFPLKNLIWVDFVRRRSQSGGQRTCELRDSATTMHSDTDSSLPYPTLLVHADDHLSVTTDIAPPLHPSTTYHYPRNVEDWKPASDEDSAPSAPIYSRVSYSTTERVEYVLGQLMGGIIRR